MRRCDTSIDNIGEDCLGKVFANLQPECRAGVIPLVSKTWKRIEEERPCQPTLLDLPLTPSLSARAAWLMRDASRLQTAVLGSEIFDLDGEARMGSGRILSSSEYGETATQVLEQLGAKAPALRGLQLPFLCPNMEHPQRFPVVQLLGRLTQLQKLTLHDWVYCAADVPLISCLSGLRSLKELEVVRMRVNVTDVRIAQYDLAAEVDLHELEAEAGRQLQAVLLSLTALTQLQLHGAACCDVLAIEDVGWLTNLRSLTFYEAPHHLKQPPCIPQLLGLTRLRTANNWSEAVPLGNLSMLEELHYSPPTPSGGCRIVISSAAVLTRLVLHGTLGPNIDDFLPSATLRNVKELSLAFRFREDPIWPSSWSQHTNLTSLIFDCYIDNPLTYARIHCQDSVVEWLRDLKKLQLSVSFSELGGEGLAYVLLLKSRLPHLSNLRIDVTCRKDSCASIWEIVSKSDKEQMATLKEICEAMDKLVSGASRSHLAVVGKSFGSVIVSMNFVF